MANQKHSFKRGDCVRVRADVAHPKYGWAGVSHKDVGIVESVEGSKLYVRFPGYGSGWGANPSEMELASSAPKISKASTKPKPSKVVWTSKKFPEMTIRTTKRQIRNHLELAIMELNDIGAKWAKAQNTINTLKKKAAK